MNTTERRHNIMQLAITQGSVIVGDLAKRYDVSAVTIRTDLNILDKKGLLVRARGGAVARNEITKELSLNQKTCERMAIKRRIATIAADQISEGDTILIDSGTTTAELALRLHTFKHLVVMTNGFNVAQNLINAEGVDVMLTGGTLRKKTLSFYGRQAEDALQRYHFDKVFLGVDGIDFQGGITTHFEYEAILNRLMCDVANEIIVITDSSKFNRLGVHKIRSLHEINMLITDSNIPDAFAQSLEQAGVELKIAEMT